MDLNGGDTSRHIVSITSDVSFGGSHTSGLIIVFLTALLGASLGFLSNFVLTYLKARSDNSTNIWNKYCDSITVAGNYSSEYWCLPMQSVLPGNASEKAKALKIQGQHLEAKIIGIQQYLINLEAMLDKEIPDADLADLKVAREDFYISLSGGDFLERNGQQAVERARKVQFDAAVYVALVQKGIRERLKTRTILRRLGQVMAIRFAKRKSS
ncbi:hypothetical protein [Asticcacaulis sp. 201]|uniref:hypothetical protein n=1 Tax=Asticcacaulis sp. 201 TaxID=3028787 RepID=UPI002916D420|nr:hypothetical protein [Asticcacaulis sp. 201]MDV6329942.1 hypothetical protein [Asticcacaulis sp. 201]